MLAPPHRQQSLGDEGAVEPLERHHVGDGAERDQVEQIEQVRLRPRRAPEAAPAQFAVHRHHGHEHQPDRGEMAELGEIVEPVRIHHRERGRQRLVGEVMIDDDRLHAEPRRFRQRLVAHGAAVDGDQQRRAASRERADRLDIRAVALEQAVGDVDDRIDPGEAQEARQRRRRGRAVDVVVAEDRDRLARASPRPRSAPPPRPCRRGRSDRASARARSDRDGARRRRSRRRGPPAPAPAGPAGRAAARSPAPAPRRARRAGRARRGRSRTARRPGNGGAPQWIGDRGTGQDGQHRSALRANQLGLLSETHRRSAMPSGVTEWPVWKT